METLGTTTEAPVLSIGAVYFDPINGLIGDEFYVAIQISDSLNQGFKPEGATVEWWLKQGDEARDALFKAPVTVIGGLIKFSNFIKNPKQNTIWAKGPGFDCSILKAAYIRMDLNIPWHFTNERDMRTLLDIAKMRGIMIPNFARTGIHHDALDDAKYQAKVCNYVFENLS